MANALEAIAIGFGLGASLAAPPGPVMAKLAFDVGRGQSWNGFLVGVGAMSADATFFTLVYFGLLTILPSGRVLGALALLGVVLMDHFAYSAWQAARRPLDVPQGRLNGWPAGYVLAATSPFNFAWWITSGAPYLERYGALLAVGFFPALLVVVVVTVLLFAWGHAKIARFETYVAYASAILLFGFGVLLAYNAFEFLSA